MLPITSPELLGKVLRHYRNALGLTQAGAGRHFNIPQKTISRIEAGTGTMQLDSVFKYMSALGLEMQIMRRSEGVQEVDW